MKCNIHVFPAPNESVTPTQAMCFVRQLRKDIVSGASKLSWHHDSASEKLGVYVSSGLSPGTRIVIESMASPEQPGIQMSYTRNGRPVFTAIELCGETEADRILLPLYHAVAAAVIKTSGK